MLGHKSIIVINFNTTKGMIMKYLLTPIPLAILTIILMFTFLPAGIAVLLYMMTEPWKRGF